MEATKKTSKHICCFCHSKRFLGYQVSTHLFSMQIITVMHVLMFAQVCGDLSHFSVELDIYVLLLAKQDSVLHTSANITNYQLLVTQEEVTDNTDG